LILNWFKINDLNFGEKVGTMNNTKKAARKELISKIISNNNENNSNFSIEIFF